MNSVWDQDIHFSPFSIRGKSKTGEPRPSREFREHLSGPGRAERKKSGLAARGATDILGKSPKPRLGTKDLARVFWANRPKLCYCHGLLGDWRSFRLLHGRFRRTFDHHSGGIAHCNSIRRNVAHHHAVDADDRSFTHCHTL